MFLNTNIVRGYSHAGKINILVDNLIITLTSVKFVK